MLRMQESGVPDIDVAYHLGRIKTRVHLLRQDEPEFGLVPEEVEEVEALKAFLRDFGQQQGGEA